MTVEIMMQIVLISHTNKTLKRLRRTRTFEWSGSSLDILSEEGLAQLVDSPPIQPKQRPLI